MSELIYRSASWMARAVRAGEVSAVELVDAHLERIAEVNPALNAVVALCAERAREEARAADASVARGDELGALHGVPFTLKDSHDTAGVVSTGGTLGRKGYVPEADSTVAARLRAAGAILLGKTACPELTQATNGNAMHARANNPWDIDRTPGGSSGACAAIVAAGGSALDFGSDTGGSIRGPAHFCGIAALKPTSGRVPRTGHIVPWGLGAMDGLTQIGPMARYVEDLALTLPITSGPDGVDPGIAPVPLRDPADVDLRRLRIAWYAEAEGHARPDAHVRGAVSEAAEALRGIAASVVADAPPMLADYFELRERVDGADDFHWVRRLLERYGTREMSPQLRGLWAQARPSTLADFTLALEQQDSFRSGMLRWMGGYDALLAPVAVSAAWPHEGDAFEAERASESLRANYTGAYNMAGWPGAVVRCGISPEGLPIGVQVLAAPWREDVVLAVAAALEAALGGWRPPSLRWYCAGDRAR